MRVPGPGRKDGLKAPPRAEGGGPVAPSGYVGVRKPPRLYARVRDPSLDFGGAPDRACPATRRTEPDQPACRPSSTARRSDRPHRPSAIDRVPLFVRSRPPTPRGLPALSRTARPRTDGHAWRGPRIGRNRRPAKLGCRAMGYRSSGAVRGEIGQGPDSLEANRCPLGGGKMAQRKVEALLLGDAHLATVTVAAEVCLRCGDEKPPCGLNRVARRGPKTRESNARPWGHPFKYRPDTRHSFSRRGSGRVRLRGQGLAVEAGCIRKLCGAPWHPRRPKGLRAARRAQGFGYSRATHG